MLSGRCDSPATNPSYLICLRGRQIFEDWTEDQFDFHSFSLRKGQIRAYIDMIRWENTLRSHPFFARAALGAVKAYLLLVDKPHLAHGSLANGAAGTVDFDKLSSADRKKALKKARREAQKQQEKEAAARALKKDEKKVTGDEAVKKEDDDPLGQKLAQTADPMADAMKFLNPLLEQSPLRLEAQTLGFEVFMQRSENFRLSSWWGFEVPWWRDCGSVVPRLTRFG